MDIPNIFSLLNKFELEHPKLSCDCLVCMEINKGIDISIKNLTTYGGAFDTCFDISQVQLKPNVNTATLSVLFEAVNVIEEAHEALQDKILIFKKNKKAFIYNEVNHFSFIFTNTPLADSFKLLIDHLIITSNFHRYCAIKFQPMYASNQEYGIQQRQEPPSFIKFRPGFQSI